MPVIPIDESRLPLVITRFPSRWESEDIRDYFERFRAIHERGERIVTLTDLRGAESMSSPATRKEAADFMKAEHDRSARLCVASAQIVAGQLMKGTLTAIHWLSPPPYPHKVFTDEAAAMRWLRQQAEAAGLDAWAEEAA